MKRNKNLKIDINLDSSDNINVKNTSLSNKTASNLKPTPLSNRNVTSRSLRKNFYNNYSIEKNDNKRLTSIKSIIQNEKQYDSFRNSIKNSMGLVKSDLNLNINDVKSQSSSLTGYSAISVKNKIFTPRYRQTIDPSNNSKNEYIKKEPNSTKNSKMPNITNPVSISDLLCFKHVSFDFNILYQSYR